MFQKGKMLRLFPFPTARGFSFCGVFGVWGMGGRFESGCGRRGLLEGFGFLVGGG